VARIARTVPLLLGLAALPMVGSRTAAAQLPGQSFEIIPPNGPATVGDSVTIGFRVRLDERDLLFDTIPQPLGDLPKGVRILSVDKLQRTPDRIFHGQARLAFYRTGRIPVPLFALPFMRAVKGLGHGSLPSDSAFVEIRPLLPAGNPPLKDIRDLERTPGPPILLWLAALLAGSGVLVIGWRRWVRRRETARIVEEITSPEPVTDSTAYSKALAALARIEAEQWPHHGGITRHYEAVADTLRNYLEAAEAIPARERTTAELLWSLPPHLSEGELHDRFRQLLDEADLVKFARHQPAAASARLFLERSRDLLDGWHAAASSQAGVTDAIR
jgi:hypothetical protein